MSQKNVVHREGNEESAPNVPIPDEQLRTMTVVELNRAVREAEYDRTTTLEIKHRRRKLKNRGYAAEYRWKGIKKNDKLIVELKSISGKDWIIFQIISLSCDLFAKNASFLSIKDENKQLQQALSEAMNSTKEKDRQIRHLRQEVSLHVSLINDDTWPKRRVGFLPKEFS